MKTDPNDSAFAQSPFKYGEDGSPLFYKEGDVSSGLTKREYFAAMALEGIVARVHISRQSVDFTDAAEDAVKYANALILALNSEREAV